MITDQLPACHLLFHPTLAPPLQDFYLSYEQQRENLPPRAGEAPTSGPAEQSGWGGGGGGPDGAESGSEPGKSLQQLQLGGWERIRERGRVRWGSPVARDVVGNIRDWCVFRRACRVRTNMLVALRWGFLTERFVCCRPLCGCRQSEEPRDDKQLEQQTQHQQPASYLHVNEYRHKPGQKGHLWRHDVPNI